MNRAAKVANFIPNSLNNTTSEAKQGIKRVRITKETSKAMLSRFPESAIFMRPAAPYSLRKKVMSNTSVILTGKPNHPETMGAESVSIFERIAVLSRRKRIKVPKRKAGITPFKSQVRRFTVFFTRFLI